MHGPILVRLSIQRFPGRFCRRIRWFQVRGLGIWGARGRYERRESASGFEHLFFVPGEAGPAAEVHWNETTQTQKILYLPGDALGSVRMVTDETGKEIERAYFDPFGQRIDENGTPILQNPNLSPAVHWGFTGYLHDYELGLIHARGRAYDPLTKHFLTPDPIMNHLKRRVSNPIPAQARIATEQNRRRAQRPIAQQQGRNRHQPPITLN